MTTADVLPVLEHEDSSAPQELTRLATQLVPAGKSFALAAGYGVALGIGSSGGDMLGLGLAVPMTLTVAILVTLPSLFVVLAMLGAPMTMASLARAALHAYRHAAVTLGGLSPTLVLLSTSIEDRELVYQFAVAGLLLAGLLGAYQLTSAASPYLSKSVGAARLRQWATLLGFVWLGFELAARFWGFSLTIVGGAI